MIEVEIRERNAGSMGKGSEGTHPDLAQSPHTCNSEEGRGIAGAGGGSSGYGLRGFARQTLEPPSGRYPPGFKFERGNQWLGTKRRDFDNWSPNVWNRVYKFPRGVREGWAGRRDGLFVGKFRADPNPKDGFHPRNCRNLRERRVLEFLMPILNPEKPKRISLTMANTLFGAMSGVQPVNWGLIIHEVVERALPNVGRKPSFLSPFILHLYQHFDCITAEEEDLLAIAADEVTYKL